MKMWWSTYGTRVQVASIAAIFAAILIAPIFQSPQIQPIDTSKGRDLTKVTQNQPRATSTKGGEGTKLSDAEIGIWKELAASLLNPTKNDPLNDKLLSESRRILGRDYSGFAVILNGLANSY